MQLDAFVRLALQEDLGSGDHTSLACIPANAMAKAKLLVKDSGILAGVQVAEAIYRQYDPQLSIEIRLHDRSTVNPGDIAFFLYGPARSILAVERLSLNIMQRMSGVATATAEVVKQLEGTSCQVLDTRKTTPLNRFLEKEAVRLGGGTNHRFGLYDMIMIKDNHVDYAGGIEAAITQTHDYLRREKLSLDIEVEARNLNEVKQIVAVGGIRRIMLDNFSYDHLREAVDFIAGRFETEASGGITLQNAREHALCGVDFISMGSLTHTIKNFDLSLKAC